MASCLVPGNFTGKPQADLLRVNLAIPPAASPNRLGLLGGDIAGFPNGRRVADDVVNIEIRAIAGATSPGGSSRSPRRGGQRGHPGRHARRERPLSASFPYLGTPKDGFHTPAT